MRRAAGPMQHVQQRGNDERIDDQPGGQLSLSGYWAAGRTEDVFQAEKRQPIGQI